MTLVILSPAPSELPPTPAVSPMVLPGDIPVVRHLRWPFRLTVATDVPQAPLALVEQDTIDDVRQCVHLLLKTPPAARPLAPQIGVAEATFTAGIDAQQLAATLEEMEDRARITVTAAAVDAAGRQTVQILVALTETPQEA